MAFRRKREKRQGPKPKKMWVHEIDDSPTGPLVFSSRAAANAGDWQGIDSLLSQAENRQQALDVMSTIPKASSNQPIGWVQEWSDANPRNAYAGAALGTQWLEAATNVWNVLNLETASATEFDEVRVRLHQAERILADACRIDPTNPAVLNAMLTCAIPVKIPEPEMWYRYQRATAHDPFDKTATSTMVMYLSPHWSGNADKTFLFARQVAQSAPEGHPVHSIIAQAYIETIHGDRRDPTEWDAREIVSALQRSRLLDGHHLDDPHCILARNNFIFALWWANDFGRAAHLMNQLGQVPTRYTKTPWSYYDEDPTIGLSLIAENLGII